MAKAVISIYTKIFGFFAVAYPHTLSLYLGFVNSEQ